MKSIIENEKAIKNEYTDESGRVCVRSNILIPEFGKEYAEITGFYSDIASSFEKYLSRSLVKKISKFAEKDDFAPYGGVMKCKNTFENDKYISVIIDVHIFDGRKRSGKMRLSHVWSKSEKRVTCFRDFYTRPDRDRLVGLFTAEAEKRESEGIGEYKRNIVSLIRSKTDFSRFYLVPDGISFYFAPYELTESGYPEVFIDKREM